MKEKRQINGKKESKFFDKDKRQEGVTSVKKALESRVSLSLSLFLNSLPLPSPSPQTATILPLFHLDGLLIFNGYNFQLTPKEFYILQHFTRHSPFSSALSLSTPAKCLHPWPTTSWSSYKMIKWFEYIYIYTPLLVPSTFLGSKFNRRPGESSPPATTFLLKRKKRKERVFGLDSRRKASARMQI